MKTTLLTLLALLMSMALLLGQSLPALLLAQPALAQTSTNQRVDAFWECSFIAGGSNNHLPLTLCSGACPSGSWPCGGPLQYPSFFRTWTCDGHISNAACLAQHNARRAVLIQSEFPAACNVGYNNGRECAQNPPGSTQNPQPPPQRNPQQPSQPNPRPSASPSGGGGGSDAGGAVAAGGAVLLGFYFVNHLTENWTTGPAEFFPDGFELDTTANVVYRDGWSGAFAGVTARYGDWTVAASSAHGGVGWSSPSARVDWRALDYAGWVVNASGSYSGGGWKPYAKVEWSWRF